MDRGLVLGVMTSQAWKVKGAGREPPLHTLHTYTHLHTPGHTHTLYRPTYTYSTQVMLTSHAFTFSCVHRHVCTHTHTSGLQALRFAFGVRGGWPSGPLSFPSPLGSLSSITGPQGGGCLACGVGPTGSSSPLRLGTPGQQRGATASVGTCVCWCVLCMCTLMECESMAGPAVSEPHFQPRSRETVVLEGSLWQGHGPHPDLPIGPEPRPGLHMLPGARATHPAVPPGPSPGVLPSAFSGEARHRLPSPSPD